MHTHRQLIQVLALVTFVLSMASSAVAQQAPCTAITFVPYRISAPGAYCLTADLTTAMTFGNVLISDNRFATMTRAMFLLTPTGKYRNNLTSGVAILVDGGADAGGNN